MGFAKALQVSPSCNPHYQYQDYARAEGDLMRHPLSLLTKEVPPLGLRLDNTCILMQDIHAPFTDTCDGWLAREAHRLMVRREFDEYYEQITIALNNCRKLLELARGLKLPVTYTCLGYAPPAAPSFLQKSMGWIWDLTDDDGRFPAGLEPSNDEPVFPKAGWGSLASRDFQIYLHEHAVRNVILAGSLFDFGIRHTSYELADAGYHVLIVSDAVAALTNGADQPTRGNVAHGVTKLRTTAEIEALLCELKTRPTVWV